MCSLLAVSHTTCPTPTGLLRDKLEIYSQAAKSYTLVVFRGDLNRVQGPGQHLRRAVDSRTARWYAR